jgi:hypothetical protein
MGGLEDKMGILQSQKYIDKGKHDEISGFVEEYPAIIMILGMLNSEINDLQANCMFIQEFYNVITDERYLSKRFYNTSLIIDTVKINYSQDAGLNSTFLRLSTEDYV